MPAKKESPSEQELQEITQQLKTERAQNCLREIEEVLHHYNCQIVPITVIRGGEVLTNVEVVSL